MKRVSKSMEAPQRENVTRAKSWYCSEAWLEGSCVEGFEPALESRARRKNDAKPERTGVMESGKCDVSLALTMIEVSA